MYRDALANLSPEQLIELVLAQTAQIEAQSARIEELTQRVAELEAKIGQPPKTPDNSSLPPSQARKPSRAERRAAKKRKGRPGVSRALARTGSSRAWPNAARTATMHWPRPISPAFTPMITSNCRRCAR
jgi:DNA-binding protein H-NS